MRNTGVPGFLLGTVCVFFKPRPRERSTELPRREPGDETLGAGPRKGRCPSRLPGHRVSSRPKPSKVHPSWVCLVVGFGPCPKNGTVLPFGFPLNPPTPLFHELHTPPTGFWNLGSWTWEKAAVRERISNSFALSPLQAHPQPQPPTPPPPSSPASSPAGFTGERADAAPAGAGAGGELPHQSRCQGWGPESRSPGRPAS